ncbi:MAG TPA: BON domain-containing protein [Ensifer sp.]|nr:BON domain-containing protein [Ensifer sp.]
MDDRYYNQGRRRGPIVAGHPDREPGYRSTHSGTYDGNTYGASPSDVPRYGPQYGAGERFDQGYGDQGYGDGGPTGSGYARYAASGFYPADHPLQRGGYGRTAYPYQRSFRGSEERSGQGFYGDRREEGEFRGKGPRGYQRADERIQDDVNDRLSDDPRLDASDIEVTVKSSEVTLSGEVASRADKRRAEDCVESVSGVTNVQNNLRVRQSGESSRTSTLTQA